MPVDGLKEPFAVEDVGVHGLGPEAVHRVGACCGPDHPGHLIALGQQAGDERDADRAGGPGNENSHDSPWVMRADAHRTSVAT